MQVSLNGIANQMIHRPIQGFAIVDVLTEIQPFANVMGSEEVSQFGTLGEANFGPAVTPEQSGEAARPHGADVVSRRAILIESRFAERGKAAVERRRDGIIMMRADVLAGRFDLRDDRLVQFIERSLETTNIAG
jgi:hypothetical protein